MVSQSTKVLFGSLKTRSGGLSENVKRVFAARLPVPLTDRYRLSSLIYGGGCIENQKPAFLDFLNFCENPKKSKPLKGLTFGHCFVIRVATAIAHPDQVPRTGGR